MDLDGGGAPARGGKWNVLSHRRQLDSGERGMKEGGDLILCVLMVALYVGNRCARAWEVVVNA